MSPPSAPTLQIRAHLERVAELRAHAASSGQREAVHRIKHLQSGRFRATYADFLKRPARAPAVRFFLEEIYGDRDFSHRDEQFGRIASALERLFPAAVTQIAVDLTEAHSLTEDLDHAMGAIWPTLEQCPSEAARYVECWRRCGHRAQRERQLQVVLDMGKELEHLTRLKSLRLGLRMMRGPARAAGLDALQHFLESGFDAFSGLDDHRAFLDTIQKRESAWIERLFDADPVECARQLDAHWRQVSQSLPVIAP